MQNLRPSPKPTDSDSALKTTTTTTTTKRKTFDSRARAHCKGNGCTFSPAREPCVGRTKPHSGPSETKSLCMFTVVL